MLIFDVCGRYQLQLHIIKMKFVLCLAISTFSLLTRADPIEDCNHYKSHYLDLGCKPVFNIKSQGRCPERYDCPFMSRSSDKCYIKNKSFNPGDHIPEGEIGHACSTSCYCDVDHVGKALLACANIECPDLFQPFRPECIKQYKHGDCCSYNEVCDETEKEKLKTCTYGSQVYLEGNQFFPENSCKSCICTADFDGTLKDSYCGSVNCGLEITRGHYVRDRCAPVFLEKRDCCPIYFKCPEGEEKIDTSRGKLSTDPELQCHFGAKKLNIGDEITGLDDCLVCKCEVPPMMTCVRPVDCKH